MINKEKIKEVTAVGRMTVGHRFKLIREHYGYNGTEFGKIVGTNQEKISRQENDKSAIEHDTLLVLLQKFGISADWVLTGKGPRHKVIEKNSIVTDITLLKEELEVLKSMAKKQAELIGLLTSRFYGAGVDKPLQLRQPQHV